MLQKLASMFGAQLRMRSWQRLPLIQHAFKQVPPNSGGYRHPPGRPFRFRH